VSTCLAFVRKFALPVAARSGGHSYAGWSSTTGLMVDVTAMNSFQVGSGQTVCVGTGLHLIDLYNRLAAHGLAVPGGSCPTVGVAGLTLGGGVGVLARAYGLTSDALEAVQIVTADGTVRSCHASSNSDLFWACRGGGGGNFGIATAFTFRAHRLSKLVVFFLSWPWSQAAKVVAGWQSWAPYQPTTCGRTCTCPPPRTARRRSFRSAGHSWAAYRRARRCCAASTSGWAPHRPGSRSWPRGPTSKR
jgi:FAD/FMN-containing dehydrogenase